MRPCPACGASNGPTDDFCGNCGAYLGWSDTAPPPGPPPEPLPPEPSVPGTPPEPPAAPDPTPAPAPPPAAGPTSAGPPRASSLRTRLTGRGPGREEPTSPPPQAGPGEVRTGRPAPAHHSATGGTTGHDEAAHTDEAPSTTPPGSTAPRRPPASARAASGTGTPVAPRAPAARGVPGPRPPAAPAPAPEGSAPAPVLPVRPARPVAPRPVVRPSALPDEVAGVPCPACGTPNLPDRRFCRRCAAELKPAARPAPLPWWRTVWPFRRRRVRASSGRAVRFLVVLTVAVALCAGGVLLLPAGRALYEDTRDKLGSPRPVTPVDIEASAEVPRHPATNTTDGLSNRYWGAPAVGASITYTFREPFRLVDLAITNGASASPQAYAHQARALQLDLEVTTRDGKEHDKKITLSDKPGPQTVPTGMSDVKTVRLVLRSATGLAPGHHLALAEVEFFQRD